MSFPRSSGVLLHPISLPGPFGVGDLGNEARMSLPNSTAGNWSWRLKSGELTQQTAERLRELTELYGRAGNA